MTGPGPDRSSWRGPAGVTDEKKRESVTGSTIGFWVSPARSTRSKTGLATQRRGGTATMPRTASVFGRSKWTIARSAKSCVAARAGSRGSAVNCPSSHVSVSAAWTDVVDLPWESVSGNVDAQVPRLVALGVGARLTSGRTSCAACTWARPRAMSLPTRPVWTHGEGVAVAVTWRRRRTVVPAAIWATISVGSPAPASAPRSMGT
ncbi:MAG: hypothetical protein ACYCSX_06700 [Acidimicrobiales bacterium]